MDFCKRATPIRGTSSLIVQLLECLIAPGHGAEVTGFLRHGAPAVQPVEGLLSRLAGRRLSGRGRRHVVATIWRDEAALTAGVDELGIPRYLAEKSALLTDAAISHYRIVASVGLGRESTGILRLFRTSISRESVDSWERGALESMGRLAGRDGLSVGLAGVEMDGDPTASRDGPAGVVVFTTWAQWDLLLAATGGRLNRTLLDIDPSALEQAGRADHFELLRADLEPS